MESGDRDEVLSWRASTVIMVVAASATLASRILGIDPFTLIFDVLIVYTPTLVLVGVALLMRTKRWIKLTAQSTVDAQKVEHKAA